jgi:hypothetical protein
MRKSPRTKAKEMSSNLEERTLTTADSLRGSIVDNSRILILGSAGVMLAQWAGWINLGIPAWWPLIPAIAAAAGLAGYVAGDLIADLIPEEEGILVVCMRADEDGGAIYELHEDTFADMFVWGSLYQWPNSNRRVYEARSYDPETNAAVGNWRESMPASAFLSERDVQDAMTSVAELRDDIEPLAAEAKDLRRRFRGIARQIDAQRTKERFQEVDQVGALDKDSTGATLSEIIEEATADNPHPHAGVGDNDPDTSDVKPAPASNGHDEQNSIEIDLDDPDPLLNDE